jgi:pheromone shutdown protein TraB
MSDAAQNKDESTGNVNVEKSSTGKVRWVQALLFVLLSLILVGGGVYATFTNLLNAYYLSAWYAITGCLSLLWGYHYTVSFYRGREGRKA